MLTSCSQMYLSTLKITAMRRKGSTTLQAAQFSVLIYTMGKCLGQAENTESGELARRLKLTQGTMPS